MVNSKMRRTGVCGAAETLLIDRAGAPRLLEPLVEALLDAGCAVRGDIATQEVDGRVTAASEADWRTEYLDAIIAVKVVDGLDAAIAQSRPTARTTPTASSPRTRRRRRHSSRKSTRRSCWRTPRPSSPTAASSASAARSASRQDACTRAGPWGSSSSAPSSTGCAATGRYGLKAADGGQTGARPGLPQDFSQRMGRSARSRAASAAARPSGAAFWQLSELFGEAHVSDHCGGDFAPYAPDVTRVIGGAGVRSADDCGDAFTT